MKRLPILTATLAATLAAACLWTPSGAFSVETDNPETAKPNAPGETAPEDPETAQGTPNESAPNESVSEKVAADKPAADEATDEPAAGATPATSPSESARAVELLQKSRDGLFTRQSVTANLREKVAIAGSTFQASGTYQAGLFPKLRLSYEIEVGKTTGTLLEVCDGQLLWTVQEIRVDGSDEPTVKVSRTVIDEVLKAYDESRDVPETILIAGLGVGGLPALLASLERSMIFDAIKEAEYDGQPYSVVQGHWNDDFLARLGGAGSKPLPEYVPDRVRIYFDQQTLFPTRILYLKKAPAEEKLPYRLLLSLEFSDIVLDGPVSEEQFRYGRPEKVDVENRTVQLLKMIEAAKEKAATDENTP